MWQVTQLLLAACWSRPPPGWHWMQLCMSGGSTSLGSGLLMAWAWQSGQLALRWLSWSKRLETNQRRPSEVGIGRVVGLFPETALAVVDALVAGRFVDGASAIPTADCPLPTADFIGWYPVGITCSRSDCDL